MALQSAYEQFLIQPTDVSVASDASFHYITTLTSYHGAPEIIKHLTSQRRIIKKKGEKILSTIESPNALALEIQTTLEFLSGGGAYLLDLDDNFLSERTVTFPVVHFVTFDGNGKILQVRQHWDQGALLKQLNVMGRTGRNWPIRDSESHIKLIASSVGAIEKVGSIAGHPEEVVIRTRSQSNTSATRDPHASLSLFAPRSEADLEPVKLPRAMSAHKPPPRDLGELFVGDENVPPTPTPGSVASKVGAGKNFRPSRLFPSGEHQLDEEEEVLESPSRLARAGSSKNYGPSRIFEGEEDTPSSPPAGTPRDSFYRPNPKKYQHFDFDDGTDSQDTPRAAPVTDKKTKHSSQWDFQDFVTPQKMLPTKTLRAQEVRHWGNVDDEVDSPVKVAKAGNPRRDAEHHFEFVDDGGNPQGDRPVARPRGSGLNSGLGLYQNNLYDEDSTGTPAAAKNVPHVPQGGIVSKVKDRSKDFDPHFTMTDESPSAHEVKKVNKPHDGQAKVLRMMESSWTSYDESPAKNTKENAPASPTRGNATIEPLAENTNRTGNQRSTTGDGMGGRKGTDRSWGFGDESDGEANQKSKLVPGKKQGRQNQQSEGSFWDF